MRNTRNKNICKNSCWKIVLLIIISSCHGCKKQWLEAKVDKRLQVPATVKDFQAMLDDFNHNLEGLVLTEIAADDHTNPESVFDGDYYFYALNAYTRSEIHPFETLTPYTSQYGGPYYWIMDMNIILAESAKSSDEDRAGIDHVRGQALFHRARMYFLLSQTFAPVYNKATAKTDLGLVLRTSTDVTEVSKRSTLEETYSLIIADLLAGKEMLPDFPRFVTRASKPAALGLLAKVYLSMGDYPNALKYANEYLQIKNELLDYSTINSVNDYMGMNKEVSFFTYLTPFPFLTTVYFIDQSLYDSYHADDLRKEIFFRVTPEGISFKGSYSESAFEPFAGIATDEMYLIRAECLARGGELDAAMKDLNDLLKTRWAKNLDGSSKYIDQSAVDETDALTRIFTERKKQLILRNVRWTDLRRLNLDDRFKTTLTRTFRGTTYILEPNSYRYTFPLPADVIQKAGVAQNIGW